MILEVYQEAVKEKVSVPNYRTGNKPTRKQAMIIANRPFCEISLFQIMIYLLYIFVLLQVINKL